MSCLRIVALERMVLKGEISYTSAMSNTERYNLTSVNDGLKALEEKKEGKEGLKLRQGTFCASH